MTDKPYYHQSERQQLRYWIFGQMMAGAGKAALVLVALLLGLYALYLLSLLLPEESKQAPAPMPQSAIEAPLGATRAA